MRASGTNDRPACSSRVLVPRDERQMVRWQRKLVMVKSILHECCVSWRGPMSVARGTVRVEGEDAGRGRRDDHVGGNLAEVVPAFATLQALQLVGGMKTMINLCNSRTNTALLYWGHNWPTSNTVTCMYATGARFDVPPKTTGIACKFTGSAINLRCIHNALASHVHVNLYSTDETREEHMIHTFGHRPDCTLTLRIRGVRS